MRPFGWFCYLPWLKWIHFQSVQQWWGFVLNFVSYNLCSIHNLEKPLISVKLSKKSLWPSPFFLQLVIEEWTKFQVLSPQKSYSLTPLKLQYQELFEKGRENSNDTLGLQARFWIVCHYTFGRRKWLTEWKWCMAYYPSFNVMNRCIHRHMYAWALMGFLERRSPDVDLWDIIWFSLFL